MLPLSCSQRPLVVRTLLQGPMPGRKLNEGGLRGAAEEGGGEGAAEAAEEEMVAGSDVQGRHVTI